MLSLCGIRHPFVLPGFLFLLWTERGCQPIAVTHVMEKLCPVGCLLPAASAMACLPKLKGDFIFIFKGCHTLVSRQQNLARITTAGRWLHHCVSTALRRMRREAGASNASWSPPRASDPPSSQPLPPGPARSCPPGSAGPGCLPPAPAVQESWQLGSHFLPKFVRVWFCSSLEQLGKWKSTSFPSNNPLVSTLVCSLWVVFSSQDRCQTTSMGDLKNRRNIRLIPSREIKNNAVFLVCHPKC